MQSASLGSMLRPSGPQCRTQMPVNINRCYIAHMEMFLTDVRSKRVYLEPTHLMLWPMKKHTGRWKVKSSNDLLHMDDAWSAVLQRDVCFLTGSKVPLRFLTYPSTSCTIVCLYF